MSETMRAATANLLRLLDPHRTPYFVALRDGSFSRSDFVETQIQFLSAVSTFGRPMLTLAARIDDLPTRRVLLENATDEHGDSVSGSAHTLTFTELLRRLGINRRGIDRRVLWPEVRAFNAVLAGVCSADAPSTALATLAIIEDLFARLSGELGGALVARGWLARRDVVHYQTHARLDVQHAGRFYFCLAPLWRKGPTHVRRIRAGFELGAYAFMRLYGDLYQARGRRWLSDTAVDNGPLGGADREVT